MRRRIDISCFYCRAETQGRRGGKRFKEDCTWEWNPTDLLIHAETLSVPAPLRETYSGSPFTARTILSSMKAYVCLRAETQGRRGGKRFKEDWIWEWNLTDLKIYAKTHSVPAPLRDIYSGSPFTARTIPSFIKALPKFSR